MQEKDILDQARAGLRLSPEQALFLWTQGSWTAMVETAHQLRLQRLNPQTVTYTAYRLINYTNICDVGCSFCSFQDEVQSKHSYVLSLDEIRSKALEAKEKEAYQVLLQGGVHVDIPLQYYLDALHLLSKELGMHVRGFSPIEIKRIAEHQGLSIEDLLSQFKAAGLGSVPGAGAEILTDNMRQQLSPRKLSMQDWCAVMGICHTMGLPGSANIVFGSTETPQDIIEHLTAIRDQQDLTQGFLSFVPWIFQPQTKQFSIRHVKSLEYLKMVALCRLFLDNIHHIEASVMVMGRELGELALDAGADDINSYVIEENVLRSRGLQTRRAMEAFIESAGFTAQYRPFNFAYEPSSNHTKPL